MLRNWISSILGIVFAIIITACSSTNPQQAQIPTNSSATRVVTLSSLATDIIYQLDKNKLVGIAGSSLFKNDQRFNNIPRVSEGQSPPNLEKIIALKPDLVIGTVGFSNQPIQRLKELGIPTLLIQVNNWDALTDITKKLASVINTNPEPLLARYQTFLPEQAKANVSTLVLVSIQPILAPNKNSWAGDLLKQFQLNNLAAELQGSSSIPGYITLSPEKVLTTNPQSIIVVNSPQFGTTNSTIDALKKEAFWQKLQATKNNHVYIFDYYGLVNPGSIDAIEKACRQLQQDLLSIKS